MKIDAITLRNQITHEVFDYQMLLECLSDYAYPRDKITSLLDKGVIVRVKKGLYVFGAAYRKRPVSREILANLIYGPSYISLEYALQHHRMIPERVREVTSVTTGRTRRFSTPLGNFSYRQIPRRLFQVGMDRVSLEDERAFLIATPEKAIADKLYSERGINLYSQREMRRYLMEDLRIEYETLLELNPEKIKEIAETTRSRRIRNLGNAIARMHANK